MFPHLSLPQAMAPDPLQKVTEVGNVSVLLDVALGIRAAPQHVLYLQVHMYRNRETVEKVLAIRDGRGNRREVVGVFLKLVCQVHF